MQNAGELRELLVYHAFSHVMRARRLVLKHSARIRDVLTSARVKRFDAAVESGAAASNTSGRSRTKESLKKKRRKLLEAVASAEGSKCHSLSRYWFVGVAQ